KSIHLRLNMSKLAEQLASLADPTPVFKDPEDDINHETSAKLVSKDDFSDDESIERSKLRVENTSMLADSDARYAGKTISRKSLSGEYSADEDSVASSDDEDVSEFKNLMNEDISASLNVSSSKLIKNESYDSEDAETSNSDEDDSVNMSDKNINDEKNDSFEDQSTDEESGSNVSDEISAASHESDNDVIKKFTDMNFTNELEKGKAVKAQLSIWDSFLEARIKMQKLLVLVNQLPQHDLWEKFFDKNYADMTSSLMQAQSEANKLMETLVGMQTYLLQRNPETSFILDGSDSCTPDDRIEKTTDQRHSDTVTALGKRKRTNDYSTLLEQRFCNFKRFRNDTIQKWGDKTRLSSGKFNHKSFAGFEQSSVKQIEQILADQPRLIRRTQMKRSNYRVLGKPEDKEDATEEKEAEKVASEDFKDSLPRQADHLKSYDSEIFDDDDFYHSLLRELIERKTSDINDPIALGRQWLEVQKLRS
ncbi:AATF (predicted), partial [Pycnogonum litorale]